MRKRLVCFLLAAMLLAVPPVQAAEDDFIRLDLDTVLGYRAVGADSITPFTQDYAAPQRQEPEVKA